MSNYYVDLVFVFFSIESAVSITSVIMWNRHKSYNLHGIFSGQLTNNMVSSGMKQSPTGSLIPPFIASFDIP